MKKIIFTLFSVLILLGTTSLKAQAPYKHALGLRLGGLTGLNYKAFNGDIAFEAILQLPYNGFGITGLVEKYGSTGAANLGWYIGAGAHVWNFNGESSRKYYPESRNYTLVGLDGILGLQYTFPRIPLDLSIDWKPVFHLTGGGRGFYGNDGALSVRYILGR